MKKSIHTRMAKLICALLALLLFCGATLAGSAEDFAAEPVVPEAPKTTEQKLEAMLPVLDSLARALDGDSNVFYSATNADFVWEQLCLMAANWYEGAAEDGWITVPAETLKTWAAASFAGMKELPELPQRETGTLPGVTRSDDGTSYSLAAAEPRQVYVVVERYVEADGAILAGFGLYESSYDFRLAGMTAVLVEPQPDQPLAESWLDPVPTAVPVDPNQPFPLAVRDAYRETAEDFAGTEATECYIRYTKPEPALVSETLLTADTLSWGSTGAEVAALQRRLNALGYSCGGENGVFGAGTLRAVRYFQNAVGVPEDGTVSPELLERLNAASAPTFVPYVNLRAGSAGVRVEEMQNRLHDLGYLGKPADGSYDERTRQAVQLFQRTAGLSADGIAGRNTLTALAASDAPACADFIDLMPGDTGVRVTELQERLITLRYLKGWANGTYDAATEAAVQKYMQIHRIEAEGMVGAPAALIAAMFGVSAVPTATPQPAATPEPTPAQQQPTATPRRSSAPAVRPTPYVTQAPYVEPTAEPHYEPTPEPYYEPTPEPYTEPTSEPVAPPTQAPEPQPTSAPATQAPSQPVDPPPQQPDTPPAPEAGE